MKTRGPFFLIVLLVFTIGGAVPVAAFPREAGPAVDLRPLADDPKPPASPVKLIFIHHSTGENWLRDDYGGLGLALSQNNYSSATPTMDGG